MVRGPDFRRWDHVLLAVGPIMTGSVILMMLWAPFKCARSRRHRGARSRCACNGVSHVIPILTIRGYCYRCMRQAVLSGFVGLVVPHIVRLLVGPDHRILLPMVAIVVVLAIPRALRYLGTCRSTTRRNSVEVL